jgi:hypothetical protein
VYNGSNIDIVDQFCYLEVLFHYNCKVYVTQKHGAEKGRKAMFSMRKKYFFFMFEYILLPLYTYASLGRILPLLRKKYFNALADRTNFRICVVAEKRFMLLPARRKKYCIVWWRNLGYSQSTNGRQSSVGLF